MMDSLADVILSPPLRTKNLSLRESGNSSPSHGDIAIPSSASGRLLKNLINPPALSQWAREFWFVAT